MSLAALQQDIRARLTDADDDPQAGLMVYRNNYRASLIACLGETHARVLLWIGEDAFERAAATQIGQHPPSHWTLDAYGVEYADTLDDLYPSSPEVGDLARLDWALAQAFVAADAIPLDATVATGIDWDSARLRPVPAMRILDMRSNAAAIWVALAAGDPPPQAMEKAHLILVWRQDHISCFRDLERGEADALRLLAPGASFSALCDALATDHGAEAGLGLAGTLLAGWLRDGLLEII